MLLDLLLHERPRRPGIPAEAGVGPHGGIRDGEDRMREGLRGLRRGAP